MSTGKARPTLALLLSHLLSIIAVAAFSHDICHHGRLGNVGFTASFPGPLGLNRYDQRNNIYNSCSSMTVCKGSASDDANAGTPTAPLSLSDIQHMNLATKHARIGYGNTFPNPAVGCVLVLHHDVDASLDTIIGSGFHPKAGMPHAEVFALFEACGHVKDGVAAARSVMPTLDVADNASFIDQKSLDKQVADLLNIYKSDGGASKLFNNHFSESNVTAYVTLEPCCHVGQTPPCAMSLVAAGIDRVVVGYRDPNPRVDGGGIKLLQDAGIEVHVLSSSDSEVSNKEAEAASKCASLVKYFVKRISPREDSAESLDDSINGKKRRAIRSIAGRQKSEGTIHQIEWPKDSSVALDDKKSSEFAEQVPLDNRFLERIDNSLWDHEIVLLRLNNVVQKKKGAKIIGERIADILKAHLAQVIGHTALLYRPGLPPVLDLDELVESDDNN